VDQEDRLVFRSGHAIGLASQLAESGGGPIIVPRLFEQLHVCDVRCQRDLVINGPRQSVTGYCPYPH
jgi:hypothetical protein